MTAWFPILKAMKLILPCSVLLVTVFTSGASVAHGQSPLAQQPPKQQGQVAEFSITPGDPILLPVTISGQSATFLLDTGSSVHVFDKRYEPILGSPISTKRARTAGADITVNAFGPPTMYLEGAPISQNSPVASMDLTPASQLFGRQIDGILGAPLLWDFVVTLDNAQKQVRLFPHGTHIPEGKGSVIAAEFDASGRPFVAATPGTGATLSFLLDTGMVGRSLHVSSTDFERLFSRGQIVLTGTSLFRSAGGDARRRIGVLKSIELGPFTQSSVRVAEGNSNRIGLQHLAQLVVTIDAVNQRLVVEENQAFVELQSSPGSGLGVLWIAGEVVAYSVNEDSPAAHAGIVEGDVLIEVNGEAATGERLLQIRRVLGGQFGSEINLVISRGGQPQRKQLRLVTKKSSDSGFAEGGEASD